MFEIIIFFSIFLQYYIDYIDYVVNYYNKFIIFTNILDKIDQKCVIRSLRLNT